MRHVSAHYAANIWPLATFGKAGPYTPLTNEQAALLREKLKEDARYGYFSVLITLADALRGLDQGFYSWSAVKLYYLVSFLLRAYLGLEGVGFFYVGTHPRWCEAKVGGVPQNPPRPQGQIGYGTSHKMAFNIFATRHANSVLLSQDIGGQHPHEWLKEQREHFNYRQAKFVEPSCPSCFSPVEKKGVRLMLETYQKDDKYLFAFDPDHALLAYPIALLKVVRARFAQEGIEPLTAEDWKVVRRYWRDKFGPIASVRDLM